MFAVNKASFEASEGSIFSLIGIIGAGKTTAIRMMMGIYFPDECEDNLRGVKFSQEFKSRVGYLPKVS